jgi:hypothetical protein
VLSLDWITVIITELLLKEYVGSAVKEILFIEGDLKPLKAIPITLRF